MPALNEHCSNCEFYYGTDRTCHRYPPQIRFTDSGRVSSSAFPDVGATDWCGEYKREKPYRDQY